MKLHLKLEMNMFTSKGKVVQRQNPNPSLKTGEIEVETSEITIINTAETTPLSYCNKLML